MIVWLISPLFSTAQALNKIFVKQKVKLKKSTKLKLKRIKT